MAEYRREQRRGGVREEIAAKNKNDRSTKQVHIQTRKRRPSLSPRNNLNVFPSPPGVGCSGPLRTAAALDSQSAGAGIGGAEAEEREPREE